MVYTHSLFEQCSNKASEQCPCPERFDSAASRGILVANNTCNLQAVRASWRCRAAFSSLSALLISLLAQDDECSKVIQIKRGFNRASMVWKFHTLRGQMVSLLESL